jgi:general L-amino acid transport system permease protein
LTRRPSRQARAAQWLLLLAVVAAAWFLASMAGANLARRHIPFGFGYLAGKANFDIPFRLISWSVGDTYFRALVICILNTLLVSALSVVTATLLGFLVGVMRLSNNWLVRNLALGFIELVRNTPQLVQIIFWYIAVLRTLPSPRQSIMLPGGMLLNIRGLYLPTPVFSQHAAILCPIALVLLLATPLVWRLRLRGIPVGARSLVLPLVGVGLAVVSIDHVELPHLQGFNIAGGVQLIPELVALWAGLSIYAAAFIAEIVRAAILSVHKGQREAALSLGLRPRQVLSKIILPQALRVIIPPLTSQYLNIVKSSSLGAAVAYPELFAMFAGTVMQQTDREIETMAILMAIFLSFSLTTSMAMNWYNRHIALRGG